MPSVKAPSIFGWQISETIRTVWHAIHKRSMKRFERILRPVFVHPMQISGAANLSLTLKTGA